MEPGCKSWFGVIKEGTVTSFKLELAVPAIDVDSEVLSGIIGLGTVKGLSEIDDRVEVLSKEVSGDADGTPVLTAVGSASVEALLGIKLVAESGAIAEGWAERKGD